MEYFVIHFLNGLAPAIVEKATETALDEIADRTGIDREELHTGSGPVIGQVLVWTYEDGYVATLVPHIFINPE